MENLLYKYERKIVEAGLAEKGVPLLGGLDAELKWNRESDKIEILEEVFDGLIINSLLYSKPAEPYYSIIEYLAEEATDAIYPSDSETRTFLHDLPVIENFEAKEIIEKLKLRKSVIIKNQGIVTWGMVSPEQAFIFYSSVCFAAFVKFFTDYLYDSRKKCLTEKQKKVFNKVRPYIKYIPENRPKLMKGPFTNIDSLYNATFEIGKKVVEYKLVDSFFGNVSYMLNNVLYVTQTGSSLDELEGCIEPCPLDGSRCSSITASSEFIAHKDIVEKTEAKGVLHGHPKFSVIMSLYCDKKDSCELNGQCHLKCNEERLIGDIPIIPGEPGAGTYGLCRSVPPAVQNKPAAIVYGHGIFAKVDKDFNNAFNVMLDVENLSIKEYFKLIDKKL